MKKFVWLTLLLCMIALVLCGCGNDKGDENSSSGLDNTPATVSPSPTPEAQTAKALRVTADSGLNIRAEASTDSEILGLAESGARLALMMEDAQNGWYQIQYEGKTAYVSADYAEVIEVTMEEYNQLRGGSSSENTSDAGSEDPSSTQTTSSDSSASQNSTSSTNSEDAEDGE